MKISFNMGAVIANNALSTNDSNLAKSLERLSTGLKINHAKDNPAGLAIAKRMNAQIKGLSIATQNASDGISVIETAEGALSEIQSMFQRMEELAVKGANGTMTDADKQTIQDEVDQLQKEITRIAKDTQFNGQGLLDGSFDLKGYSETKGVELSYYSDEVAAGKYSFTVDQVATFDADGNQLTDAKITLNTAAPNAFPDGSKVEYDGNAVTVKAPNGFEMTVRLSEKVVAGTAATVEASGIGAMRLQIGATEGQILELRIPKISLENMHMDKVNMSTQEGAKDALDRIDYANNFISQVRSRLGAYQNRLDHSISSLDISNENMTAAYSRIMDIDMATEMTEYTKYQVLTQAGTSMLAQANERPQQVLQLLQ